MKKLLLLLVLLSGNLHAQQPEKIYSFAVVQKPVSWYKEQILLWKKEVDKNPQDGLAWYYYYYATRNTLRTDPEDTRTHKEKDKVLEDLVAEMGKVIPDSYEYNLCMWQNHGFDLSYYPYLEKAFALGADRTEHLDFIMNLGEINRDLKQRDEGARLKNEAGMISPGMLYYNHNVLAGLEPNAILLTTGDNDTYPAWVLQGQGFRKDVTVLNLSLLTIDSYREKVFKELGVPFSPIDWESTSDTAPSCHTRFLNELVIKLSGNKKNFPVYVALTAVHKKVISKIEDDLYLTGLAYLYTKKSIDDMAILKKNFEQEFTLDYIEHPYYHDISETLVPIVSQNYIVPMLKLYDHYKASGDMTRQNWVRAKVIAVSKGTEAEIDVLNHLD